MLVHFLLETVGCETFIVNVDHQSRATHTHTLQCAFYKLTFDLLSVLSSIKAHVFGKEFKGSEDCLYLDLYRPANTTATSNLPVMVWIRKFVENEGWRST